jgi:hypothetical protein
MNKRPVLVTITGWLYIVVGAVGFAYHFTELKAQHLLQSDVIWVELVRLTAILAGVYILRGHNWARWVALAWIVLHVVISAFHRLSELAIHSLLCVVLAYFLFNRAATRYFRAGTTQPIKKD